MPSYLFFFALLLLLFGKGNKYRTIPITNNTKDILITYIDINKLSNNSILFSNPKFLLEILIAYLGLNLLI